MHPFNETILTAFRDELQKIAESEPTMREIGLSLLGTAATAAAVTAGYHAYMNHHAKKQQAAEAAKRAAMTKTAGPMTAAGRIASWYSPQTTSRLMGAGGLGALGAAGGGLLGAGVGGVRQYRQARSEGADQQGALVAAGTGAFQGGRTGAIAGGLAGGAAGALAPGRAGRLLRAVDKTRGLGEVSRFGQRQVHSITGAGDLQVMHGPSWEARQALGKSQGALEQFRKGQPAGPAMGAAAKDLQALERHHAMNQRWHDSAADAEASGLTSLPGAAMSLAKDPLGTMRKNVLQAWHSGDNMGKTMMLGGTAMGVAGTANAIANAKDDPNAGEHIGANVAGTVAPALLSSFMPGGMLGGQALLQGASHLAGAGVGRVVDSVRRARTPHLKQQQADQRFHNQIMQRSGTIGMNPSESIDPNGGQVSYSQSPTASMAAGA